jgi:hypothetical protein
MSQLEYGDYYKFIASVGIALIAVAILLPWLFLHESFAEIRRQRRSGDRIHIPMTRLSAAPGVHPVTAYLLQQIRLIAFAVDRASSTE